jgi:hypothetical protein
MADPIPFPLKGAAVINERLIRHLEKKYADKSNAEIFKSCTRVALAVSQRFRPQMNEEEGAAWDMAVHLLEITKDREEAAAKRGLVIREVTDHG